MGRVQLEWPLNQCAFCLTIFGDGEVHPNRRTDAHVIPKSLGGNLSTTALCFTCNSRTGTEFEGSLPLDPRLRAEMEQVRRRDPRVRRAADEGGPALDRSLRRVRVQDEARDARRVANDGLATGGRLALQGHEPPMLAINARLGYEPFSVPRVGARALSGSYDRSRAMRVRERSLASEPFGSWRHGGLAARRGLRLCFSFSAQMIRLQPAKHREWGILCEEVEVSRERGAR